VDTEASTACSCTCGAAPARAVTRHQYAKGHPPLRNKQYMLTLVADQARQDQSLLLAEFFGQPTPFSGHRNEAPVLPIFGGVCAIYKTEGILQAELTTLSISRQPFRRGADPPLRQKLEDSIRQQPEIISGVTNAGKRPGRRICPLWIEKGEGK